MKTTFSPNSIVTAHPDTAEARIGGEAPKSDRICLMTFRLVSSTAMGVSDCHIALPQGDCHIGLMLDEVTGLIHPVAGARYTA